MMCNMCEAHMSEAIRRALPDAKKVRADHGKNEVVFLMEDVPDEAVVKKAVDETGYTYTGISAAPYEKKGLFG